MAPRNVFFLEQSNRDSNNSRHNGRRKTNCIPVVPAFHYKHIYRQNELVNEKPLLVASLEAVFVLRTKLRAAMDIVYCILFILHTRYLVIFSAALARH